MVKFQKFPIKLKILVPARVAVGHLHSRMADRKDMDFFIDNFIGYPVWQAECCFHFGLSSVMGPEVKLPPCAYGPFNDED